MADAEHKLSRRAVLGVAFASPVLSALKAPAFPAAPRIERRWQAALTDLAHAETRLAALEGTPDEDAFDDAVLAFNRSLERLLLAPAPDIAALAAKLSLTRRHLAWELPAGDAAMEALERDAHRLAAARA